MCSANCLGRGHGYECHSSFSAFLPQVWHERNSLVLKGDFIKGNVRDPLWGTSYSQSCVVTILHIYMSWLICLGALPPLAPFHLRYGMSVYPDTRHITEASPARGERLSRDGSREMFGSPCGKAELWLRLFLRSSNSIFWRISGDSGENPENSDEIPESIMCRQSSLNGYGCPFQSSKPP